MKQFLLVLGLVAMPWSALTEDAPYIPIVDVLPPLVSQPPAPDRAPECGAVGLDCIIWVEEQLAAWEAFFGCDHRAVFATVYRTLIHENRLYLEREPDFIEDPAALGYVGVEFYKLYDKAMRDYINGDPVTPSWQVAMDATQSGDWTGLQDLFLAINAHVQGDMPYAVAGYGLNLPDGRSRKPDHDQFNEVLNDAYDAVLGAVAERYDPFAKTYDDAGLIVDNLAGQMLVALWREGVWRNAEQIVSTRDTPLQALTDLTIEQNAHITALALQNGEMPGYRATRDAYCVAQAAARAEEVMAGGGDGSNSVDAGGAGLSANGSSSGGCSLGRGNNGMGWMLLLLLSLSATRLVNRLCRQSCVVRF